jgi:mitochondrial intermediate peptidase
MLNASLENVMHFLRALGHHHRPLALSEISELARQKAQHSSQSGSLQINAWDRDFYTLENFPGQSSVSRHPSPLSIGSVFRGLSQLFSRLYGISLRVADTAPGETWHSDVKKLEVLDEDAGVMGWIYADLFTRPGKHRGAAHYTVRCSRRVDRDDWIGDLPYSEVPGSPEDSLLMFSMDSDSDMGPRRVRGKEGLYQLPIAVLSCEFAKPIRPGEATILQWHEIETLFHEMGHALHCACFT